VVAVRNTKNVVVANGLIERLGNFNSAELMSAGLNLQAVFNLNELSDELVNQLKSRSEHYSKYSQLILLGHGGKKLWHEYNQLQFEQIDNREQYIVGDNPIDEYSCQVTSDYFDSYYPQLTTEYLYPKSNETNEPLGLQALGKLVGWHSDSLLKIGINPKWGTWFAYRVVLLADSSFTPTPYHESKSSCLTCQSKNCVQSCPAKALSTGTLELETCCQYRQSSNSLCQDRCLARIQCPVAKENQYDLEQIQYHYGCSMRVIKQIS